MKFTISSRRYSRTFIHPLKTAKGVWTQREGFLIQLESDGRRGYGEVAPIPEFGTESLSEAADFLHGVGVEAELESFSVPESLPCCSFAFSSALAAFEVGVGVETDRHFSLAGLLPSGVDALRVLAEKQAAGFNCFKWKIGVESFDSEWRLFRNLLAESAPECRFRLDANASLSSTETRAWLESIRSSGSEDRIEFIEQPMPVGSESQMANLSKSFGIPIALDESLNGAEGHRWLLPETWSGPRVLKPCLLGSIATLEHRLAAISSHCVFSSSFETSIGLAQCLKLAHNLYPSPLRLPFALGFDTQSAFGDSFGLNDSLPKLSLDLVEPSLNRIVNHAF
ncbi:MAG: o-succinylbenzoate synthase [Puniceicoccaceae bacterium]|nr:o-succinylbenzoate synthase [Puniceicoccaceae bacterium]RCL30473.1 MAG: o-succinylbenzoate synthase [Puniceicoccaceae bacterium]